MANAVPAYGNQVQQGGLLADIFATIPAFIATELAEFQGALSQLTQAPAPSQVAEETYDHAPSMLPTPGFR